MEELNVLFNESGKMYKILSYEIMDNIFTTTVRVAKGHTHPRSKKQALASLHNLTTYFWQELNSPRETNWFQKIYI
jgi:hypothetical protein